MSNTGKRASDYDPLAPQTFTSNYAQFRELRDHCPLAWSDAFDGFWMMTRYDDVVAALADWENYITSVRNVVPGSSTTGRRPPLHLDPPEHTPYRRALERVLRPSHIAGLEPVVRGHAARLMDEFATRGGGDLIELVASPFPALVFGEWMGITPQQTEVLWATGRAYVKAWENFDKQAVAVAAERLAGMAAEVIADRRAHPRDPDTDPTSSLLAERDDSGNPFPENLLAGCVRQVLVVGLVAPPIVTGSIAVHLAEDLELQDRLRANPDLIPAALEEFLRLYTPYRGFARSSRRPMTLHGRTICPGEAIALGYASANRDERVFTDPDSFRLDRENIQQHIAFGRGPHRCAGMPLARLELRVMLEELLVRTSRFRLAGPLHLSGMPEIGPISVPLSLA